MINEDKKQGSNPFTKKKRKNKIRKLPIKTTILKMHLQFHTKKLKIRKKISIRIGK